MTDKVEIQGKTVDEAVSEALLRMGARRDEVDVTVLEEPKTGFLGLLGSRPARVIVRRRPTSGKRRNGDHRQTDADHQPHDLGGSPANRGDRGGRGRRGRSGARAENAESAREGGSRRGDSRRDDGPAARSGSRGSSSREDRGDRRGGGRAAAARTEDDVVKAGGESRDGNVNQTEKRSGARRRRGRRGGRGRSGGNRDQQAPQNAAVEQERAPDTVGNAETTEVTAEPRTTENPQGGDESGRGDQTRRGGGRGGRGGGRRSERPARAATEQEQQLSPAPDQGSAEKADVDAPPRRAATVADEPIAAGIKALSYAQPQAATPVPEIDEPLAALASGMLVRAGFPCRCEIKPGEYRLVKIVTDDASAGMLIGRHGQTIDAVEHLVERMISTAAGDRVRMNLDINNYRRRRQDSLVDRVAQAVAEVQATGNDYHLESMDARERRICHLEAALTEGLRTWTVNGPGGKHVVIGVDDGTTREGEIDPIEVDEDEQDNDRDQEQAATPDSTETVLLDADSLDLPADEDEQERPGADS